MSGQGEPRRDQADDSPLFRGEKVPNGDGTTRAPRGLTMMRVGGAGTPPDELGLQGDRAGGKRDDAAEQRDQVGDERDHHGDERDRVADSRDDEATRRDAAGARRDQAGAQRDVAGARRDSAAQRRDQDAELRDHDAQLSESSGAQTRDADDLRRSSLARSHAASDRRRASEDRMHGARERGEADLDRDAALADRGAGASERGKSGRDRDDSLADRGAGAGERTAAEHDRESALVNRGAAARERAESQFDDLTGAYRRTAGFVELEREISRVRRAGEPLVLAFIDVDGLKSVNDSHGHAAGDLVLRAVAGTLRAKLRPHDIVMRYGGDEFVCVAAGVNVAQAKRRFALVSAALEQGCEHGSVTIGLAELQSADTAETLVARADDMLYRRRRGQEQRDM